MDAEFKGEIMKQIALILCLVASAGCTSFRADVNSFCDKAAQHGFKYDIAPAMKEIPGGDLQFREACTYLERLLAPKGYTRIANPDEAELVVFVSYGIGEPQTHYSSYTSPVYGTTGGGTTHFQAQTFGSYGSSTTTGTMREAPGFGVVGQQTYNIKHETYHRFLTLAAIDWSHFKQTKNTKEVWKIQVSSSGSSGDLRRVLPILFAATEPYIGKDTGKNVEVELTEDSKSVLEIKGESVK